MKLLYLGDTFDAVKRLWQEVLLKWAPLYAEPRFIPQELRTDFKKMTKIPILGENGPKQYSILNDPDTGIYSPDRSNQPIRRSHVSLEFIREQLRDRSVRCVVTFDQSVYRKKEVNALDQRAAKLRWLARSELEVCYCVSHAPFLFACHTAKDLKNLTSILLRSGIPKERIQMLKA